MSGDEKLKHLEFIQSVINRMSGHSFVLKGWSVTLVVALFAFSTKDMNVEYVIVAFLPIFAFWLIDAYFLSQERLFIALYNDVRTKTTTDFSMNVSGYCGGRNSWWRSFFSRTLLLFYLSTVGVMIVIVYLIR